MVSQSKKTKVIVLRTAGTNCDKETANAFHHFGAQVDLIHINKLFSGEIKLKDYHILAIPGGFTYGDDIDSGRILANELTIRLGEDLCKFIGKKKIIIGICNGFQVLAKSGVLPGALSELERLNHDSSQKITLTSNNSGKFEDCWTHLKVTGNSVWTKGLEDIVYYPVAHAEGKFVTKDLELLDKLIKKDLIAFRYCTADGSKATYPENPNGSVGDIAGITDETGCILGLMPHPERHFYSYHHPQWTRMKKNGTYGQGAQIFKNGVNYVKEKLL